MDLNLSNSDGHKKKSNSVESDFEKKEVDGVREKDEEVSALLAHRRGGISKKPKKARRNVQWNDRNGNKLVEVLEFEPSDASDSDDDDNTDSCICAIM